MKKDIRNYMRRVGEKGVQVRMQKSAPEQRSEIAGKAAPARRGQEERGGQIAWRTV
jgi:hypothetical protein